MVYARLFSPVFLVVVVVIAVIATLYCYVICHLPAPALTDRRSSSGSTSFRLRLTLSVCFCRVYSKVMLRALLPVRGLTLRRVVRWTALCIQCSRGNVIPPQHHAQAVFVIIPAGCAYSSTGRQTDVTPPTLRAGSRYTRFLRTPNDAKTRPTSHPFQPTPKAQ